MSTEAWVNYKGAENLGVWACFGDGFIDGYGNINL